MHDLGRQNPPTTDPTPHAPAASARWWRGAAIYQVYVRSFADANGDGTGDLAGVRSKLRYLADLGVDAIWFNPWYPSTHADGGYDVTDYRAIDPLFGDLEEAKVLIAEAHDLGLRIIVDVVPNHVSDENAWFLEALAAEPGSEPRSRFWFRPGRGESGEIPPNDWDSIFGGPAWTRTTNPDGTPGEWYLHLFAPQQPDVNWANASVWTEFEDVLRFWFDLGADGFRIDSGQLLMKDASLAEFDPENPPFPHPYVDRDEVHEVFRSWRKVAESYARPRALIGEVWVPDAERLARYLRPDELHTVFNFDFLGCPWDADAMRGVIDTTMAIHEPIGAPPTWVLSNHDVTRHVTRYGREDTSWSRGGTAYPQHHVPTDLALGRSRARAAAMLTLALPGATYIYQGEELGLEEVEAIPDEIRKDPIFWRTHGADLGRDGCRVPLPWSGTERPFGFSPASATAQPWLPQPEGWSRFTAEAQQGDQDSMLELYRSALAIRRGRAGLGDGPMQWLDSQEGVLFFTRGEEFACLLNLSDAEVPAPDGWGLLLASDARAGATVPADAAVWLGR